MAPKLQVAGTQRASFRPGLGRSSFGVEDGQVAAASALTKVGEVMEGLAIERNQNEGTLAGIEAQKQSSIALFQAQQSDPVNFAENAKKILEETRLNSTKGFTSKYAEESFNSKWNSFAASRMVNAYQVQETEQKRQNIQVTEMALDKEYQNIISVPEDTTRDTEIYKYSAEKLVQRGVEEGSELWSKTMEQQKDRILAARISGYTNKNNIEEAKRFLGKAEDSPLDADTYNKLEEGIKKQEAGIKVEQGSALVMADELYLQENEGEYQKLLKEQTKGMDHDKAKYVASQMDSDRALMAKRVSAAETSELNNAFKEYMKSGWDQKSLTKASPEDRTLLVDMRKKYIKSIDNDPNSHGAQAAFGMAKSYINSASFGMTFNKKQDFMDWVSKKGIDKAVSQEQFSELWLDVEKKSKGESTVKYESRANSLYKSMISDDKDDMNTPLHGLWISLAGKADIGAMSEEESRKWATTMAKEWADQEFELDLNWEMTDTKFKDFDFTDDTIEFDQYNKSTTVLGISKIEIVDKAEKIAEAARKNGYAAEVDDTTKTAAFMLLSGKASEFEAMKFIEEETDKIEIKTIKEQ